MEDIAMLGLGVDSGPIDKGKKSLKDFEDQAGRTERATKGLEQSTALLTRAMGFLGAALSVQQLIRMTSAWTDLNSRVANAVGSHEQAAAAMKRIDEMARRTYSSIGQTAETFLLNAKALNELGYSTERTFDFVESLNNALVVSGAKGERAEQVMNALSKAIGLGKLSGDNLNTVLATGGRVAEALADGLGVSTLELRKMGAEGKLTTSRVVEALTSQLQKLRDEADAMPATLEDAFTLLGNAIFTTVGKIDEATGASSTLAEAIIAIGDNIDTIIPVVGALVTLFAVSLTPAIVGATTAFFAFAASPIGIIALAIGGLAYVLTSLWNEQRLAEQAAKDHATALATNATSIDTAKTASAQYRAELHAQVQAQIKVAEAALASTLTIKAQRLAMANALQAVPIFGGVAGAGMNLFNMFEGTQDIEAAMQRLANLKKQLTEVETVMTLPPGTSDIPPTRPTDPSKADIKAGKDYREIIRGAQQYIAEQRLEAQVLGMTSEQASRLRHEQELLNQAANDNIKLTPDQRKELEGLAAQMAATEERTRLLTESYEFGKETFRSFFSDLRSDLMNGTSLWEAFAKAGSNALDRIADRALSMAADGIFDMIFGAVMGGISGGMGGGKWNIPTSFVAGGFYPGLADGGTVTRSGLSWVGENGPELLRLPQGAQVMPHRESMAMAANQNSGGISIGNITIHANSEKEGAAAARGFAAELNKHFPSAMERYQRNPLRRKS